MMHSHVLIFNSIIAANYHKKIIHMINLLYNNANTLYIHEFQKNIAQLEELICIKLVIARKKKMSSCKKFQLRDQY